MSRAHFAHVFEPQPCFKTFFRKAILSRGRVQCIAFLEHTFDFRRGFTGVFESITKPQRETQNGLSEHRVLIFTGLLQWFSKRARKKYYKTSYFRTRVRQRADPIEKTSGLEHTCAPHRSESTTFGTKRRKPRAGAGDTH